jgi:hydrogenase expression/formation protein HypC
MCLAIPGRIVEIQGEDPFARSARVSFGGTIKLVNLACVPEANVDDYVLVHVGVALSVVDEAEARAVFSYLEEIGELEELAQTQEDESETGSSSHVEAPP